MFGNGPDESHVDPPHISFGGSTTMCSRERGFYTHAHPPVVCLMEMFVFDGSAMKQPQARPLPHQHPFKTAMCSASPPQYRSSSPSSHAPSATHTVRSPIYTPRRCTPGTSLPTAHRQARREGPQTPARRLRQAHHSGAATSRLSITPAPCESAHTMRLHAFRCAPKTCLLLHLLLFSVFRLC